MLAVEGVVSGYGDQVVLKGVDLELPTGSFTAVIGPNGAGKTTLLKTIFGVLPVRAGSISLDGIDIAALSSRERLKAGMAWVPQGRCNFPEMTVQENLEMGAYTRTDGKVRSDILELYELFPLIGERREQRAGDLSGGEQQLLQIAMAMILHPSLMLIDEPSLGLAVGAQELVFATIERLHSQGTSILLVEQNATQALRIAERGVVLDLGHVSIEGTGVEMLADPEVRRAYLGIA
jgi:branched-chain amino acid transport system ATP-binding protein